LQNPLPVRDTRLNPFRIDVCGLPHNRAISGQLSAKPKRWQACVQGRAYFRSSALFRSGTFSVTSTISGILR
jgi:hypothetical protein